MTRMRARAVAKGGKVAVHAENGEPRYGRILTQDSAVEASPTEDALLPVDMTVPVEVFDCEEVCLPRIAAPAPRPHLRKDTDSLFGRATDPFMNANGRTRFCEMTVVAEQGESGRVAVSVHPPRELDRESIASPMLSPVVVDVVEAKKDRLRLPATRAMAAIRRYCHELKAQAFRLFKSSRVGSAPRRPLRGLREGADRKVSAAIDTTMSAKEIGRSRNGDALPAMASTADPSETSLAVVVEVSCVPRLDAPALRTTTEALRSQWALATLCVIAAMFSLPAVATVDSQSILPAPVPVEGTQGLGYVATRARLHALDYINVTRCGGSTCKENR